MFSLKRNHLTLRKRPKIQPAFRLINQKSVYYSSWLLILLLLFSPTKKKRDSKITTSVLKRIQHKPVAGNIVGNIPLKIFIRWKEIP